MVCENKQNSLLKTQGKNILYTICVMVSNVFLLLNPDLGQMMQTWHLDIFFNRGWFNHQPGIILITNPYKSWNKDPYKPYKSMGWFNKDKPI